MDVSALALAGATALVQAMTTNAWESLRPRFASLFGTSAEATGEELEQVRTEVTDGETEPADVEGEWAARLRRVLKADPDAAAQLQAVLDEAAPKLPAATTSYGGDHIEITHNTAHGDIIGVQHNASPHRREK